MWPWVRSVENRRVWVPPVVGGGTSTTFGPAAPGVFSSNSTRVGAAASVTGWTNSIDLPKADDDVALPNDTGSAAATGPTRPRISAIAIVPAARGRPPG